MANGRMSDGTDAACKAGGSVNEGTAVFGAGEAGICNARRGGVGTLAYPASVACGAGPACGTGAASGSAGRTASTRAGSGAAATTAAGAAGCEPAVRVNTTPPPANPASTHAAITLKGAVALPFAKASG